MKNLLRLALVSALACLSSASAAAQAPCQPAWLASFGSQPGVDSYVYALAEFDDGSGPALYVGGGFAVAGGAPAKFIAKWDGTSWSGVGGGLTSVFGAGAVRDLLVFDDGSGPALYAAGMFDTAGGLPANNVAKWDGTSWTALGAGTDGMVMSLAVFDDGSGPALHAGGGFTQAGGAPASRVAKWNGTSWSALGGGLNGGVHALEVFDDGSGPALFAGGNFNTAGGAPALRMAKWDGASWSALGSGIPGGSLSYVDTLVSFDDGSGPALYAGGDFVSAGGVSANYVARWNGSAWSALGAGTNWIVTALTVYDDGSGADLYAGGWFTNAGSGGAQHVARWSGSAWSPLGGGTNGNVEDLAVYDDGSGAVLCAGGSFTTAQGLPVNRVARWNGSWAAFGGGGLDGQASALVVHDDGSGPALFVGGWFTSAGLTNAQHVAKWDGASWAPLGSGTSSAVLALTVYDSGSGPELIAGGIFFNAGGQSAFCVARWDGNNWWPLGSGMGGTKGPNVGSLTVFDDGAGPKLYASGNFFTAGGVSASRIARWDGTSWSALGSGLGSGGVLCVYDDGGGDALYAGGSFTTAGGVPVNRIAKWDGSAWSALGSGLSGGSGAGVGALGVFDVGAGPRLGVGGLFTSAGGVPASNIASWDGSSWSALGSGISGGAFASVYALTAFDDGSGPALFAGGGFTDAGGTPVNHIARWDGSAWSALGNGFSTAGVFDLAGFDDGNGPSLYAGGSFASAIDSGDTYLAQWGNVPGCGDPGSVVCEPGLAGVMGCPCANPPSVPERGCDNSSATGGAKLEATGIARISFDTLVFHTRYEKPTATSIVLQGDGLAAGGVVFGQGVRCVAGNLKRLYQKTAVAGSVTAPVGSDLAVHARSAELGDAIAAGTQRFYGVYYRDPIVLGGCSSVSTYNVTQQLSVLWTP